MTHVELTNDSNFLSQPPKHSGSLLSSPQRGIGAEERWWNSLLSISPHCCERTLQLRFLCKGQAGEGPDRHSGVPFLRGIAGTQAISLPTMSLAACRSQRHCLASTPSSCLAQDTMRQLHELIARCVQSLSLGSHSEAKVEPGDSLNIQPFLIYPVVISLTCNLVIPAAMRILT